MVIFRKYILFIFLILGQNSFSQTDPSPFRFWRLTSLAGQINLRGNYRESKTTINDLTTRQSETYMNGILQVRTQSYFVHPNFMLVNLYGIYNPETRRSRYIGAPDISEKNNSEGIDGTATFFKKKNFNLTTNASFYNSIQNIDNLTQVRDINKYFGNVFSYYNKALPFSLSYSILKTDQKTLNTDRRFTLDQKVFQATANKTFTARDKSLFSYSRTEKTSSQKDIGYIIPLQGSSKIDFFEFSNALTIGSKNGCTIASSVANSDERGTLNYRSFAFQENVSFKLPKQFVLSNLYNYRKTNQEETQINYQRFQSTLSHQLFQSLYTQLLYEHSISDQPLYKEQRDKGGIDLRYMKKIPNGKLLITYTYNREYLSIKTPPTVLRVLHEEYTLTDNVVTLLKNQFADINSVIVKDATGNTIYQLNLDYILIDKSPYVEIVRVYGGLIPNNAFVYIDYAAVKPGALNYNMNYHNFNSDFWLFNNVLNLYYRLYTQDYPTHPETENQVFNVYNRHIIGTRLDLKFITAGVEYENCRSNILPYYGMKYYMTYQKMFDKINFNLNGTLSDYQMTNEMARRKDFSFRGKVAYSILKNSKINLDYMYFLMKGRGIDLVIQSAKIEITTNLHLLFASLGTELNWSKSEKTNTNYKGAYIQLTRNF